MKKSILILSVLSAFVFYSCNSKKSEEEIQKKMTESYTHFLEDQGYKDITLSFNEMDSATENTIDSMILRNLNWDFKGLTAPRTEEDIAFDSLFNLEESNRDELAKCKQEITEIQDRIKNRKNPKTLYRAHFLTTTSKIDNYNTTMYEIQDYHVFFTTDPIEYVDRVADYSSTRNDEY
ncbi:MAG: hypothetical protein JXR53_01845 [Bacteroidales bacterium]|nr:hypothetical protein [Bacteroidales bacterium]